MTLDKANFSRRFSITARRGQSKEHCDRYPTDTPVAMSPLPYPYSTVTSAPEVAPPSELAAALSGG